MTGALNTVDAPVLNPIVMLLTWCFFALMVWPDTLVVARARLKLNRKIFFMGRQLYIERNRLQDIVKQLNILLKYINTVPRGTIVLLILDIVRAAKFKAIINKS